MKFPRKQYGSIGYLDFGKKICLAICFGSFFIKPSQVVLLVGCFHGFVQVVVQFMSQWLVGG